MNQAQIGVIGGSGLYQMPDLENIERIDVPTPFGSPSDTITIGTLSGQRVAFLPRHGRYHQYSPSDVPVRANIWALKSLGVTRVISISAVGSMREEIEPLHFVIPDQIFDRTVRGNRTLFEEIVVHVSMADPFCTSMRDALIHAASRSDARVHPEGTYVCIEGPQFSTKGESRVFRSWGMDIIGMTAMPEARLAREAELCYVTLAMVTDYDVWHDTEETVTVQAIIENLQRNVALAQDILRTVVSSLTSLADCGCGSALEHAIVTNPHGITAETRSRYSLLVERYLPVDG